jgi:hypothetical protein
MDGIGVAFTPGLADGGDVVDIDTQLRSYHGGLASRGLAKTA